MKTVNRMLSVKDIIDALSAADLDRVDLAQIKVFRSLEAGFGSERNCKEHEH